MPGLGAQRVPMTLWPPEADPGPEMLGVGQVEGGYALLGTLVQSSTLVSSWPVYFTGTSRLGQILAAEFVPLFYLLNERQD